MWELRCEVCEMIGTHTSSLLSFPFLSFCSSTHFIFFPSLSFIYYLHFNINHFLSLSLSLPPRPSLPSSSPSLLFFPPIISPIRVSSSIPLSQCPPLSLPFRLFPFILSLFSLLLSHFPPFYSLVYGSSFPPFLFPSSSFSLSLSVSPSFSFILLLPFLLVNLIYFFPIVPPSFPLKISLQFSYLPSSLSNSLRWPLFVSLLLSLPSKVTIKLPLNSLPSSCS